MEEIVQSEVECAVEIFVEAGDYSQSAISRFLKRTIREIKVTYQHIDPRWINEQVSHFWLMFKGEPLSPAYFT